MRNEHDANMALQPMPLAARLQSAGWHVGRNALQPVKPRACVAPVQAPGMLARIISILFAR